MAKINFNQIFDRNSKTQQITPRTAVRIGGVTIDSSVTFGPGISWGGVDLSQFINNDFEVDIEGSLFIIKGIYTNNTIKHETTDSTN